VNDQKAAVSDDSGLFYFGIPDKPDIPAWTRLQGAAIPPIMLRSFN
jgi:hypothetical protein